MALEAHRLVFIDETGTTTDKMTRLRGRCPKGERLKAKAPFGHWKAQTVIAALLYDCLSAPFVVDAPMNRTIFEISTPSPSSASCSKTSLDLPPVPNRL